MSVVLVIGVEVAVIDTIVGYVALCAWLVCACLFVLWMCLLLSRCVCV